MSQQLNPYITFNGDCAAAMSFYADCFDVEPVISTFRESGMDIDGVMHAEVNTPAGFHIFAADHAEGMGEYQPGTNIQLSISGDDEPALRNYWESLSAGGTVFIPLQQQMWGATYGQFVDKFGIVWHVNINPAA